MKKRWSVAIIAVITWLVVTTIFYNNHQVTIKSMTIPGWEIQSHRPTVLIKEVRLINKKRKSMFKDIEVIWKFGNKSESKHFKAVFNTHTYNFFEQRPKEFEKFDPEEIASKLFFDFKTNKNSERINPDLAQNLAWVREYKNVTIFDPSASYLSRHKKILIMS